MKMFTLFGNTEAVKALVDIYETSLDLTLTQAFAPKVLNVLD